MDNRQDKTRDAASSFINEYDKAQQQETNFLKLAIPQGFLVTPEQLAENGVLWQHPTARRRSEMMEISSLGTSNGWFKDLATTKKTTITGSQEKNLKDALEKVYSKFKDLRELQLERYNLSHL